MACAGIVMGTSRAYVEATLLIHFGGIILLKYYECALTYRNDKIPGLNVDAVHLPTTP